MNFSTTVRRLALAVPMLTGIFWANTAWGQACPIGVIGGEPINIQVVVDPLSGVGSLQSNDLVGVLTTAAPCDPVAAYKIRFYADEAKTMPIGTFTAPTCILCVCGGGGVTISYSCADINTTKVVWAAINDFDPGAAGLPGGCTSYDPTQESEAVEVNVTILDHTGPQAAAPASVVVNTNPGVCTATGIAGIGMTSVAANLYAAAAGTYTDNSLCNVTVTYTLSGATTLGPVVGTNAGLATFNKGVTTVTYTINDTRYSPGVDPNPVTVAFTVTVNDMENPTIACPGNAVRNTNANACVYTISGTEFNPTVGDNCSVASTTYTLAGATVAGPVTAANNTLNNVNLNLGVTQISWSVTDGSGNVANCGPFNVTVNDIQPPALAGVPANVPSLGTSTGVSTPGNLCDGETTWTHPTFTDNCNPLAFPPAALTMELSGATVAAAASVMPGASSGVQVLNLGTTTVTYVATDNNGVTASTAFTITVVDNQAPTVTYVSQSYTVNAAMNSCAELQPFTQPSIPTSGIVDCNAGSVTLTRTITGPDTDILDPWGVFNPNDPAPPIITPLFPAGTTVITYTWCDGNMNCVSRTVTVTVTETQNPTVTCVPSLTLQLNNTPGMGSVNLLPNQIGTASDNCLVNTTQISKDNMVFANSLIYNCPIGSHTVYYKASDFNGNTASCSTTLSVTDNIPPVVTCPLSQNVSMNSSCVSNAVGLVASVVDNCTAMTWEYKVNAGSFSSFAGPNLNFASGALPVGSNTVTIRVTDGGGNIDACTFTLSVVDQTPPTLSVTGPSSCSGGLIARSVNTVFCNYVTPPATPLWTVSSFGDPGNCSLPVNVSTVGGSATGTYPQGDTPITISAVDASGNVTNCTFTVRVTESTPPTALCKDVTVPLLNAPVTLVAADFNNNSTDNCTLGSSLTLELVNASNVVIPGINVTVNTCTNIDPVRLRVTDFNGNSATCTAKVVVNDNVPPVCQTQNVTLFLNASGTATLLASQINAGSSDNCTASPAIAIAKTLPGLSANATSLTYTCSERGMNTVHFKATDSSPNSNTCVQTATVTVVDNIPPTVASNPGPQTVACSVVTPNVATWVTTLPDATFADNCSITGVVESHTVTPGACPNAYTIVRTWVATDVAGLTVQAQQTITVQDNVPPTITTVPANLPANVVLNLSNYSGCFPTDNYTVTVLDNCASINTTNWQIEYADNTNPLGPDASGSGTTTNNALGFSTGVNTVTFTTTDQCNNSTSKVITVTVVDNEAPAFDDYLQPNAPNPPYCGATLPVVNINSGCSYSFSWYRPYAGDPIFFPLTILPDVTDCNDFLDITENIVTDVPVGPDQVQTPSILFNEYEPLNALVPQTLSLPVGTTTFKYTATDEFNNTFTCSFSIQVKDISVPTISCPVGGITINSICPDQKIQDYRNTVVTTDNCAANLSVSQQYLPNPLVPSVTLATVMGGAANVVDGATFPMTFTVSDNSGNSATCVATVTLNDDQSPLPNVTPLADLEWDCGFAYVDAPTAVTNDCNNNTGATIYGTPGGVSAIGIVTLPGNPNVVTKYKITSPPGTYFITWSYNDGNGNVSTQLQKLIINPDELPPVARCKATTTNIVLNPATASITANQIDADNGSFNTLLGSYDPDACGPFPDTNKVTLSLDQSNYTCADLGKTTVTLIVTDVAGNTATCSAAIKVIDNIFPVIDALTVPADTTYEVCSIGFLPPPAPTVTATDNCSATVVMTQVSTQGSAGASKYDYTITRTWTATDASGNAVTAHQVITVKDVVAPAITVPANLTFNTEQVTANCSAQTKLLIGNMISDCAPDNELTVVVTPTYFSISDSLETLPVGTHPITITVTDPAGNVSDTTFNIVVVDIAKPNANCINGIAVALNANGQAVVTPSMINNQSNDNCGSISFSIQQLELINGDTIGSPANQLVFDCGDADNDTQYPIILWVTDNAGNFNFCETYVVIQDNVAPTLTCPANKTVECSGNLNDFTPAVLGMANANDNCPQNLTVTHADNPAISGFECQGFVRTFTATDLAGNTGTCNQIITVIDNKPPKFVFLPPNDTIACVAFVQLPIMGATDNCTVADSIKITLNEVKSESANGTCGDYTHKLTRTWTAVDKCGNTATHVQIVVVRDTIAPEFPGMPDTINVLSANFPPTTNCTVPVVLNAEQFFSECSDLSECTINSITFDPPLLTPITPNVLDVSGNFPVGLTKVTFTVTDPCGNVGVDSVVVRVKDNSTPVVICNASITAVLSSNGEAEIDYQDIDLNSYDNCGIDTFTLSQSLFDCANLGTNLVTMTATDIYGNANSCTAQVTVTLGNNSGFTLTASATNESYFGADNGTATAVATGGTGVFTYAWSNQASTAALTNLPAGTYTVTVTDTGSGCVSTASVTVVAGPKITLTVGTGNGCQSGVVSIPVVVDNFIDVTGFAFALELGNAAAGTITSISNPNAALPGITLGVNNVFWTQPNLQPTDLPNGTVLFNVNVTLSQAAVGTNSLINLSAIPAIVFLQNGVDPAPMVTFNAGGVSINCPSNDLELKGVINTWKAPVKPIPGVDVTLAGPPAQMDQTALPNADYGFFVAGGSNTTVTANKVATAKNNKINVGDMLTIQAHAALQVAFNNGYQWVAADINGDKRINLVDYALVQKYVLGAGAHFTDNQNNQVSPDWRFIPESHVFMALPIGNPAPPALNPLNNPAPPQQITHNNIQASFLNDNFTGVLIGDVNGDVVPSFSSNNDPDSDGAFKFRITDRTLNAGDVVNIPFKSLDFNGHQAYQTTIAFDPEVLALEAIEPGVLEGLSEGNFGTSELADGKLTTLWVGGKPSSYNDNETLFSLRFKVLESAGTLEGLIRSTSDVTEALAIDQAGNTIPVELGLETAVATGEVIGKSFALHQNQPNPFSEQTTIAFRLPEASRATLRVFSAEGRLVRTVVGNFAEGEHVVTLQKSDLGANGVYYYELETPKYSGRKKMILLGE